MTRDQKPKTDKNEEKAQAREKRPIPLSVTLKHYKRKCIQKAMVNAATSREVAVRFGRGFGKRPDVLHHPRDILEFAKQGASSFHVSEERWFNPLQLNSESRPNDLEELRSGWDLVLDIDCSFLEYSKIAAKLCIDVLHAHGIKSVSVKFSGNKGFHIAVPFEAFPKRVGNVDVRKLFPDAARRIAAYIGDSIINKLSEGIMNYEGRDFAAIMKKTGKKEREIVRYKKDALGSRIPVLDAKPFLEIDTILISPRHLYRMPWSLHEKSGLVSVPIMPEEVLLFEKASASPEKITDDMTNIIFLDKNSIVPEEARMLFIQALDYSPKYESHEQDALERLEKMEKKHEIPEEAIPVKFFPPCIQKILMGLKDGRKRSVFLLTTFLANVGWGWDQIESFLREWNEKNSPPLRENVLVSQIRYRKMQKKLVMPPNFENKNYYDNIGCPADDPLAAKAKNPVNYAKIKARSFQENAPKRKKTSKKDTKNKPSKENNNSNKPSHTQNKPKEGDLPKNNK